MGNLRRIRLFLIIIGLVLIIKCEDSSKDTDYEKEDRGYEKEDTKYEKEGTEYEKACVFGKQNCSKTFASDYKNEYAKLHTLGLLKFIPAQVAALSKMAIYRCVPKVTLNLCNTAFSGNKKWAWKRRFYHSIHVSVKPGCNDTTTSFQWVLGDNETGAFIRDYPEHKNKPILPILYYELEIGVYILSVIVKESILTKTEGISAAQCMIRIVSERPEPFILGGHYRMVRKEKSYTLNGRSSINWDIPPDQPQQLEYKWHCKVEKGPPLPNFCKGPKHIISYRPTAVVPKALNQHVHSVIEFFLNVRSDGVKWYEKKQIVLVYHYNNYARCLKNCRGIVNSHVSVYVDAVCDQCGSEKYKWEYNPNYVTLPKKIIYGAEDRRLYLPARGLTKINSEEIRFNRYLQRDKRYVTTIMFITPDVYGRGGCQTQPRNGRSLETVFKINCNDVNRNDYIFKFTVGKSHSIVIGVFTEKAYQTYLPAGSGSLLIKMEVVGGLFDTSVQNSMKIDPYVGKFGPENQIEKLMEVYNGQLKPHATIDELVKMGDTHGMIRTIYTFIEEANAISDKAPERDKFQIMFKTKLFDDLRYKFPLVSPDELFQAAGIMARFRLLYRSKIDAHFSMNSLQYCARLTHMHLHYLTMAPSKVEVTVNTIDMSRNIFNCAIEGLRRNYSDIVPRNEKKPSSDSSIKVPIQTTKPNDDYDDDIETKLKLQAYKEATASVLDCFITMSLALVETLAQGEPMPEIKQIDKIALKKNTTTAIHHYRQGSSTNITERVVGAIVEFETIIQYVKDEGKEIFGIILGGYNSYVVSHSRSLMQSTYRGTIMNVVLVAFNETPYWWHPDSPRIGGPVLSLSYFIGIKPIRTFSRPIRLLFHINNTKVAVIEGTVTVPKDINDWLPKILDNSMVIYRIDLIQDSTLRVEFYGLSENNKVQVAITYARRPSTTDFISNGQILSGNNSRIISYFPRRLSKYGDTWAYVAVLPHKDAVDNTLPGDNFSFNYNVSLISSTCVVWNDNAKFWNSKQCSSTRNDSKQYVSCTCSRPSTFGIFYENATYKIDHVIKIEFTLTLGKNYLIFICVWIIFALYAIGMVLGTKVIKQQQLSERKTLFLSDNQQSECYAYLVIIKTGNLPSAGTTSNVGLKIFGQNFESRAHIVNYPDPDLKLLQKGKEDWFLLTTENHLGDLTEIYLWHDSVGQRPAWYCEWVSIWDLQTQDDWYFEVDEWFCVLRNDIRTLSVEPTDLDAPATWKQRYIKKMLAASFKSNHTWNLFSSGGASLQYLERITIILSIFLTTYVTTLILYGFPVMRLRDGLDYGHYNVNTDILIIAILSSLMSFVPNMALAVLFKRARTPRKETAFRVIERYPTFPWTLVIILILVCLTTLTVCSLWVPYVTSLLWLTSTIGALLQSILILENVYILVTSIWQTALRKSGRARLDVPKIVSEAEEDRRNLFSTFGAALLRPYFSNKYRPLSLMEWNARKAKEIYNKQFIDLLHDFIMLIIYLVLLCFLVIIHQQHTTGYSHKFIESVISGAFTKTVDFEDLRTPKDFFQYVNSTLIPGIQTEGFKRQQIMSETQYMIDGNTKILGVARIRQLRVKTKECDLWFTPKGALCIAEFSSWYNDKGNYSEWWENKEDFLEPRLAAAWSYNTDAEFVIGEIAIYPGGGYTAPLGKSMKNSMTNLKYLIELGWFDKRTRAIFIEFLAYNANIDVFHMVKLTVERSSTALFIKSSSIITKRMIFSDIKIKLMAAITLVMCIIMIIAMLMHDTSTDTDPENKPRWYHVDIWNMINVLVILNSISLVGLYYYRNDYITKIVQRMNSISVQPYIDHHSLVYVQAALGTLGSMLTCFTAVRLFYIFKLQLLFKVLMRILTVNYFQALFFCHMVILTAYSLFGFLYFGPSFRPFRGFFSSFSNLFLLSVRLNRSRSFLEPIEETQGAMGRVYLTSFLAITLLMYTLYVATVIYTYTERKQNEQNVHSFYAFIRYLQKEFSFIRELFQKKVVGHRLAGGNDFENLPQNILPKEHRFRYKNAIATPEYKLFVMSLITRCVLRNSTENERSESLPEQDSTEYERSESLPENALTENERGKTLPEKDSTENERSKPLTENDVELMQAVVYHLLGGRDIPEPKFIVFSGNEDGERKLVSNNRIIEIEDVVRHLLTISVARNSEIVSFDKTGELASYKTITQAQLGYFQRVLKSILALFNNINITIERETNE